MVKMYPLSVKQLAGYRLQLLEDASALTKAHTGVMNALEITRVLVLCQAHITTITQALLEERINMQEGK